MFIIIAVFVRGVRGARGGRLQVGEVQHEVAEGGRPRGLTLYYSMLYYIILSLALLLLLSLLLSLVYTIRYSTIIY